MDFMRQIMFGVTSVELQCECGDISNRILVGRLEAPRPSGSGATPQVPSPAPSTKEA